jgi:glycine/D-amino acid oxidase-like deaminating enzyme
MSSCEILIIGGDRQLNAPKTPDQTGIETNRYHALQLFPFLRDLPIARTWVGWMPFTHDLHPPHRQDSSLRESLLAHRFEFFWLRKGSEDWQIAC